MFGSRGQEEAPFSILLAVAMMAMVIPIAAYMFQSFQAWECQQRLDNNLQTFARDLELASALGGGKRIVDIDLSLSSCSGIDIDRFVLASPGMDRCQEICHDPNCKLLQAVYDERDPDTGEIVDTSIATDPVCVRIPVNVNFVTNDCHGDEFPLSKDGNFKPGYYRLSLEKIGYTVKVCELKTGR